MFRSTAGRREEEKERDVQVEVSYDLFEKLCSIVVTEDKHMQTVVAVPSENGATRHRFFRKNNTATQVRGVGGKKEMPGRMADSFRPLSPTPKDRHSGLDSDNTGSGRGRGRTVSHSCPPPLSRGAERVNLADTAPRGGNSKPHREQSCPPAYNRSMSFNESSSKSKQPVSGGKASSPKKSKDLVSKTASRNRVFGAIRKSGRVIPAPRAA